MSLSLYPQQQKVVEQISLSENSLIEVPTGGGKTIILIAFFLKYLKSSRHRILFLAPTNILVSQHYTQLCRYIDPSLVSVLYAGQGLTLSSITICTAHYAQVLFKSGYFKHDTFKLIAMDEAHKAKSISHPYATIAVDSSAVLLGATASLGTAHNRKAIFKHLKIIHHIRGQSPYQFKKTISVSHLENQSLDQTLKLLIKRTYETHRPFFQQLKLPLFAYHFQSYNFLNSWIKNKNKILFDLKKKNKTYFFLYYRFFHLFYMIYLYCFQDRQSFLSYLDKLNNKMGLQKNPIVQYMIQRPYSNAKFEYVVQLLKQKPSESTYIIFFENYETALSLKKRLQDYNTILLGGKAKMRQKERDQSIELVNQGGVDCVLCTSVIEEGVNVKSADKVILYTPISNQIRWVQRKGRTGRFADGSIEILSYKNSFQETIAKKYELV